MTWIGLIAGALTTGCWLPQLIKAWRTRSTEDVSWLYLAVFGTGIALWLVYGSMHRDFAIVVTNGLTLTLTLCFVVTKVKFDLLNKPTPVASAAVSALQTTSASDRAADDWPGGPLSVR
jgi:MtN3 and saliva related transmembrane protein